MPRKYLSKINKNGDNIYIKDSEARESIQYEDIYIGAAVASSTIISSTYHYNSILRGRPIAVTAELGYIWAVIPASYNNPIIIMGGIEVPKTVDSTTTIEGKEYNIWKSANIYTGTFNLYML
jgi:uncharacterized protein YpuA (DUF1002 family)